MKKRFHRRPRLDYLKSEIKQFSSKFSTTKTLILASSPLKTRFVSTKNVGQRQHRWRKLSHIDLMLSEGVAIIGDPNRRLAHAPVLPRAASAYLRTRRCAIVGNGASVKLLSRV